MGTEDLGTFWPVSFSASFVLQFLRIDNDYAQVYCEPRGEFAKFLWMKIVTLHLKLVSN